MHFSILFQALAAYYVFALCNQYAVHCMNDSLEGGITSFMTDQKRAVEGSLSSLRVFILV